MMGNRDIVKDFWVNRDIENYQACPNVSFFRFIGGLGIVLNGKSVCEVGFGANNAADLLEVKKRGGVCFGVDINPLYVQMLDSIDEIDVAVMRAGVDEFPFNKNFDLIYSRDTIYYLTNDELDFFIKQCNTSLNDGGFFVFQFVECDLEVKSESNNHKFEKNIFTTSTQMPFHKKDNPVKFLDPNYLVDRCHAAGFNLIGTKSLIQSYDNWNTKYRVDKYLAFKRKNNATSQNL